jgi:hypothetical protein
LDTSKIAVKYNTRNITINIPVGLLTFSQTYRDDIAYNILDKKAMAKYISENILEYTKDIGRSELGLTDFLYLLDNLFDEAYESAEEWIEESNNEEE